MSDTNNNNLPMLQAPRLPYHPRIEESFGIDRAGWKALVEAIFPSAKTTDAVCLALSYCKARHLDPFKRMVHIVPVWDSHLSREVETVWPGIAEHRTTAVRTGEYAGCDAAEYGPATERTFTGERRGQTYRAEVTFPEWCQITVYRVVHGTRVPIPGPRVYWLETYSGVAGLEVPNQRWQRAPYQMAEKCAEAAALRRAFPEEIGDQYTDDDVGALKDVTPHQVPPRPVMSRKPEGGAPPQPNGPETTARPEPSTEPPTEPPPRARRRRVVEPEPETPPPSPPEMEPSEDAPIVKESEPSGTAEEFGWFFGDRDGEIHDFETWEEAVAAYADMLDAAAKQGTKALEAAWENGEQLIYALKQSGRNNIVNTITSEHERLYEAALRTAAKAQAAPPADPIYVPLQGGMKIEDWFPRVKAKLKQMTEEGKPPSEFKRFREMHRAALQRLAEELPGWSRVLDRVFDTATAER